jgi:integrase
VIQAPRSEFDKLAERVWIVPGERMKQGREHRVPLCDEAVAIVSKLLDEHDGEFVFPGRAGKGHLSHSSMIRLLRRLGQPKATVHGFRSTFADWRGDLTNFPEDVAEARGNYPYRKHLTSEIARAINLQMALLIEEHPAPRHGFIERCGRIQISDPVWPTST